MTGVTVARSATPQARAPGMKIWRRLLTDKVAVTSVTLLLFMLLFSVIGPWVYTIPPNQVSGELLSSPSQAHPLGTDTIGRDTLARLMAGGRISFIAAFGAGMMGLLIGFPLGLISGYLRGPVDAILMRVVDTLFAFPSILLVLALVAVLGSGLDKLVIAIGFFAVPSIARLARGQALEIREADYVEAARSLGGSPLRIVSRHVAPNVASPVLIQLTLVMAGAVLVEAALGFLGAGVPRPNATWGGMLLEAFPSMQFALWQTIIPGVAIFLLVASLNMFGDTLRDLRDPRLRGSNH